MAEGLVQQPIMMPPQELPPPRGFDVGFSAHDLVSKKLDPFLVIYGYHEGREPGQRPADPFVVAKTEFLINNPNPMWSPCLMDVAACYGFDAPLKIRVYDYDADGSHDLIGEVSATLREIVNFGAMWSIVDGKTQKGTLKVQFVQPVEPPPIPFGFRFFTAANNLTPPRIATAGAYFIIRNSATKLPIYRSSVAGGTDPQWEPADIDVAMAGGMDGKISVEIRWTAAVEASQALPSVVGWEAHPADELVGNFACTLRHLTLFMRNPRWRILHPQIKPSAQYKNSGFYVVNGLEPLWQPLNIQIPVVAPPVVSHVAAPIVVAPAPIVSPAPAPAPVPVAAVAPAPAPVPVAAVPKAASSSHVVPVAAAVAAPVVAAAVVASAAGSSSSGSHHHPQHQHHGAYSLGQFMQMAQAELSQPNKETFHLTSEKMLEIRVTEMCYVQKGSMVAYKGNIKFEKGSGGGLSKKLLKSVTGEGASMMKCIGQGTVWVADQAKNILVLKLNNEGITVNGNDLIAMEQTLHWDICYNRGAGKMAGGLFNMKIRGVGFVAIATHGTPLVLPVSPDSPVFSDPNATVAWSDHLEPKYKTDISFKSIIGKGSGEEFQMHFVGPAGFVVIQPYEEVSSHLDQ